MLSLGQIHPLVIHFPIAFFISLFLLDLYAWAKKIPFDGRGGMVNLSAGLALLAGMAASAFAVLGLIRIFVWWRKFSLTRWMRPCSISPDHRAAGLWAYSGSTPAATTAG